jgi:hypothetical protein
MSNNKQQTAVDWYDNQLRKVFSNTTEASNFSHEELLQQAKEMYKQQIIQAYQQGVTDEHGDTITFTNEGEDYYNTLFKL